MSEQSGSDSPQQGVKLTPFYAVCRFLCRVICFVMFDLQTRGTENVPSQGGVLLVSNHQSYIDPALLGVHIRRPVSYLAKAELFDVPIFGWGIRRCNAFPVRRGSGDIGAVKETITRLQAGGVLNIFPEGSRSLDGELRPMEKGAALVIRRAKVPVVPVAIHGSYQAWPKGKSFPRPAPVRLLYGQPMDLSNLPAEEITKRIETAIRGLMDQLKEQYG